MARINTKLVVLKDFYKILPVILLATAIALSPSFSLGTLEGQRPFNIRAEDIVLFFLLLSWAFSSLMSGKNKFEKPPFLFAILAWLLIGFFGLLTNWIFGNTPLLRGFFFFLKEMEFFLIYFYVFSRLYKKESVNLITDLWIFLGFVHAAWIAFELVTGYRITYYYGPTTFIHPQGVLPGAGFLLMIFIFLFNILLYYYKDSTQPVFKRFFLFATVIGLMIGIISSGSRNVFFASIFAIFLTFLLYILKEKDVKSLLRGLFMGVVIIFLISCALFYILHNVPTLQRLLNKDTMINEFIDTNPNDKNNITRIEVWHGQMNEALKHPLFLIFGFGKAVFLFCADSDSQYLRNFIEVGVVGSLIFFYLIFLIIKKSFYGLMYNENSFIAAYSAGLIVATFTMLLMSISSEVFTSVKIVEVYWFFAAMTMAVLTLESKFHNKNETFNNHSLL